MSANRAKLRRFKDKLVTIIVILCFLIALIPLVSVLYTLIEKGLPVISYSFLTTLPAPVGEKGGIANSIIGSLLLLGMASLIAVPVGICVGIYVAEHSEKKLAVIVRFFSDVLSGVPAIVVGVFIYTLVVIPMRGFSAIAGALSLAVIMVPIIIRTSEEAMKMVPRTLTEAGIALGISRAKVTILLVLRACWSSLLTGVLLAVARVAGEAAPLLFTALNNREYGKITEPMSSLPVQIFTYAISPFEEWKRQAWGAALVLVAMILIMNIVIRTALWLGLREK